MKRALLIFAALLLFSFLMGWWRAGSYVAAGTVEPDVWNNKEAASAVDARKTAKAIRSTGLFLLSRQDQQAQDAGTLGGSVSQTDTPKAAPPFPTFASAFRSNGVNYVTLVLAGGDVLTVKAGQDLPSGWRIKDINLNQVIAVFGEEETRFPVREYLDTAFDEPEIEDPKAGGE